MLPPVSLTVVAVFYGLLLGTYMAFTAASGVLIIQQLFGYSRSVQANLAWYWTRWPALAYVLLRPLFQIILAGDLDSLDLVTFVCGLIAWWTARDLGDDEDHKKLKRKLNEQVKVIGGKLRVVVPEAA